jgi:hypothetical protein
MSFPFPQKLILINQHILLNHHLFASEVHLSRLLVYFLIELKIKYSLVGGCFPVMVARFYQDFASTSCLGQKIQAGSIPLC